MKKIIRTNNLQKALEDYDALKGQTVTYVSALPVSPNIRSQIYGIEETHTSTKNVDYKISELLSGCAEEVSTDHYKIKDEFTVSYEEVEIKAVEVISDAAMLYEDEDFKTALPVPFELNVDYEFVVATSTKEVAFYVGEASSQTLHPVVKFAEITALNDRIDEIVEGMDSPEVGGANKYIASIKQEDGVVSAVEGNIDNTVTENSSNLITSGAVSSYVSGLGLTNNGLNVVNLVATNATTTDLNVTNIVANKLVADDANIDNATITNLIANGVAGNDGQVLGKVNGNIEWVSTGIDTNDFSVNHLTVNESESVNGDNFTHKGFDVTSMTVVSEDDFNNLSLSARGSSFYMTTPNGNMYFHGVKFAPQGMVSEYSANVSLPNMAANKASLTTSTLTFTRGAVTNNFVNGGAYAGIKEVTVFGEAWNNSASVGTQSNDGNIITNATQGLYITNAANMFFNCRNLTDCFITNPSLIINAPENYDPMKYCTNMADAFYSCYKLNLSGRDIIMPNNVNACNAFKFTSLNNINSVTILASTLNNVMFNDTFLAMGNTYANKLTVASSVISDVWTDELMLGEVYKAPKWNSAEFNSDYIGTEFILNNNTNRIEGESYVGPIKDLYLPGYIAGLGYDEFGDYVLVPRYFNLSGIENDANVHISSRYSVTTSEQLISPGYFTMPANQGFDILVNGFYYNESCNTLITKFLTSGIEINARVYDSSLPGYRNCTFNYWIGHDFTGHIINDL